MATTVTMPQLGESVVEGTVGEWMVSEGQYVKRDQPLVTILTDKTDTDIPAPTSGVVTKLLVQTDEVIEVGASLCEIDEAASASATTTEAPEDEPATAADASGAAPAATPSVRKLARENDVDLKGVAGSGEGGRITREDVLRSARGVSHTEPVKAAIAPPTSGHTPTAAVPVAPPTGLGKVNKPKPAIAPSTSARSGGAFRVPAYRQAPGDEIIPFSRRRRIIADHMVYSKMTSPHVVTFAETDLHRTYTLRNQHKKALRDEGINLTFLAFVAAATARALRETRVMNARVLDDQYALIKEINLGIAVETEQGLVVPVVRNADELSVRGLARAIGELAKRAREGRLTPDDLANKTFTISNPGRKGNLVGAAIISQPNVGILRMGEIKKRVVVVEHEGVDTMAIHPVMYMALSYDHRIVDGVAANTFLYKIDELLESGDFDV